MMSLGANENLDLTEETESALGPGLAAKFLSNARKFTSRGSSVSLLYSVPSHCYGSRFCKEAITLNEIS